MAKAYKGTMGVAFPIESIDRKLALRREKAGTQTIQSGTNNHSVIVPGVKYMGGFTRTYSVCTGSGKKELIKVQYMNVRKFGRTSPASVAEIGLRNRFAQVSQGVVELLEDLTQVTQIQQKYLTALSDVTKRMNGVSAKGYASLRQWVFAVQYAGLKASESYDVTQFPANFDN